MTTIYTAMPMSAFWQDSYNSARIMATARWLVELGFEVVTPIDLDRAAGIELDREPESFTDVERYSMMGRDLEAIFNADAVWAGQMEVESKGRDVEIAFANFIGRPVFYVEADLLAWRAGREAMAA